MPDEEAPGDDSANPTEDVFPNAANTPAETEEPASTDTDDFVLPGEEDSSTSTPAEEESDTATSAEDDSMDTSVPKPDEDVSPDDPFGDASVKTPEMRLWVDNTGTFKVTAKLVEVNADSIRILKDNGRTSTVPMSRLSSEDRMYVAEMSAHLVASASTVAANR